MKIKPYLTEKSYKLASKFNKYTFVVDGFTSKIEVAKAIGERYNVKVTGVRSIVLPGKMKTNWAKYRKYRKPDLKKVIVTLKDGDKIEEFFNVSSK